MKRRILIAGAMLCGTLCMATEVQSLVVQVKGGTESTYALSNVQKITFSGSNMTVVKKDATPVDYTISNVQKLLFGMRSITAINEVSSIKPQAYPNPAKEELHVEGISKVDNLHLYNLTGSELSVSYSLVSNGVQISTGNLPQGIYLLQVNNQVIKFQKR